MSAAAPTVSVVIATYNDARWLPETLESALAQTYLYVEIVVVDDGSTDDTAACVEPYRSRLRYVRRRHEGLAGARNAGVALATGDFVALLDADDLWLPEKLVTQVAVAERHPESGLIACDGVGFSAACPDTGRLLGLTWQHRLLASPEREITGRYHEELIDANQICAPAQVLIPRRVLREIGPFADSKVQDYDCYLRIAQRFPVTVHGDLLARYRERPDSMSGPVDRRGLVWGWDLLRALRSHAGRCGAADRQRIERRVRAQVRAMAYDAYAYGLTGRRLEATRILLRLLRQEGLRAAGPYLTALWTPGRLRRRMAGALRTVRRMPGLSAGRAANRNQAGHVEPWTPELEALVPHDAKVEQLAGGFAFTEGPVWMPGGYLLFADLPHNVIRKWHPAEGASVLRTRTGYSAADVPPGRSMGSNGMTLDAEGRLTICEAGNRRVTRQEPDGTLTVLADRFEGRRLNSPNDLVYRSDGALYFTDPPHGLPLEDADPAKELPWNGVYRWAAGRLTLVTDDLRRPNGLAFSPDERYLYVGNSDPRRKIWMRYEVEPDGSLANGQLFLDLTFEPGQEPDGLKVDQQGNLYLTGPRGLWIVDPRARVLGVIRTPLEPANVAWGDPDGRALYLTARSALYRVRVSVEGIRPPLAPAPPQAKRDVA